MTLLTRLCEVPYFAVIFSSIKAEDDTGYASMADRMMKLAAQQPGFIGVDSAREEVGITVSYWKDLASIQQWKNQVEHREAQRLGKKQWYESYTIRIAKVERQYDFGL
ncbi:antibiotic biosynthesis monooxygenase [Marinobacter hydrocarbonoclasticus]|uniref:antibiotic biosynthesis monooxygenase family protein n=1 Tax=Marinobacter nauticus TaxID=2743 RepID=UPI001A8EF714|nr:antibiotic biosynthesis monooxygenase [Marinobacter nauticus]MBN8240844.1 antibiotic biosynthesis monooxygenase [Marinobacter nauticus]|tara:strand:+ start:287 stop:610 length:324 start_codon:yes stop_codon:yes gene_type:complete